MARGRTHYLDASALVKLVIQEDQADKLTPDAAAVIKAKGMEPASL